MSDKGVCEVVGRILFPKSNYVAHIIKPNPKSVLAEEALSAQCYFPGDNSGENYLMYVLLEVMK